MPRPKTREALLAESQKQFDQLIAFIDSFSPDVQQQQFVPGTLNRNIRDVLGHIHHWHTLMIGWYEVGMKGEKPAMPAEGYSWKTTPDLNREIHAKYVHTSLAEMRALFSHSHEQVQALIAPHSQEELFTKKHYKWTGSTSLGAYLISATVAHYEWGKKLIKKGLAR